MGRAVKNGMNQDAWVQFYNAADPGAIVLVKPFHWQGGALLAALTYNDQRLAISQAPLFLFHPGPSARERGNAHVADHVLAMVTAHYRNLFFLAKTWRKRALNRVPSDTPRLGTFF